MADQAYVPQSRTANEIVHQAMLFARRRWLGVVVAFLAALGVGFAYLTLAPPTFVSAARVLIEAPGARGLGAALGEPGPPISASQMESEIQIAESEAVINSVVKSLNLAENPAYAIRPAGFLTDLVNGIRPGTWVVDPDRSHWAASTLSLSLEVVRAGFSNLLEIRYTSSIPEESSRIANAVTDAFIAGEANALDQSNTSTGNWLNKRSEALREQAESAERAVVEFKKQNNIVSVDGKSLIEQKLLALTAQAAKATQSSADAKARLDEIKRTLDMMNETGNFDSAISDKYANPTLTNLRQQYSDLQTQQRILLERQKAGPDKPEYKSLETRLDAIRAAIKEEIIQVGERLKSESAGATQQLSDTNAELQAAVVQSQAEGQAAVRLRELEDLAKSYRNLYNNYLERSTQAEQIGSFPNMRVRVIDRASPPLFKSRPKPVVVLGLAVLVGLAAGLGFGFLRELMDRGMRTRRDVEDGLDVPCVALVPNQSYRAPPKPGRRLLGLFHRKSAVTEVALPQSIEPGDDVFWAAATRRWSRFAESVRSIKLSLDSATLECPEAQRTKFVGIISSLPGEGKSTLAAALAVHMAKTGARTLLIDFDLRNPCLSRTLVKEARHDVVAVLQKRSQLSEAIWIEPDSNLSFLPAPTTVAIADTAELFRTDAMRELFRSLKGLYDYVVLDMPPLAPLGDVRAAARLIDHFFLVVEWGRTTIDTVRHSLSVTPEIGPSLMGVILNKVDFKLMKQYDPLSGLIYNNPEFKRYRYASELTVR